MITANGMTLRIGARDLIVGANLRIDKGMRVGLVGRNGAGKTTLTKLLAGDELSTLIAHDGTIQRSGTIGYLPQDPRTGDLEVLARDRVLSARGLDEIQRRLHKAEVEMGDLSKPERAAKATERYVRLDAEFAAQGGWAARSEAAAMTASLGLPDRVLDQPLSTLSGGQRRRIELARILFSGAQTLLLDEPTNHLDHDSILWLRDYLRNYDGGLVVISHDVELLRETINVVWHLDATQGELEVYNLGWDAYLVQREQAERRRKRERANAEKKASALLAQADKMRAKATKAVAAQNMIRRAEAMTATLTPERKRERVANLRFPDPAPCGRTPLTATGLSKSYGSLEVFTGVNLAIDRGSKVVVLGLNGAGKTTLLRLLGDIEESDTGEVTAGHGLKIGYYAQEHETLDTTRTVVENLRTAAPDLTDTEVRNVLGSFLFSGDDADKPAGVLSGGEKTRLALAVLVVSSANVLLLDEPTNNLDPVSRDEILSALHNFSGAVILVSHDEGAVKALQPERVLLLPEGDEDLWREEYLDLVTLA